MRRLKTVETKGCLRFGRYIFLQEISWIFNGWVGNNHLWRWLMLTLPGFLPYIRFRMKHVSLWFHFPNAEISGSIRKIQARTLDSIPLIMTFHRQISQEHLLFWNQKFHTKNFNLASFDPASSRKSRLQLSWDGNWSQEFGWFTVSAVSVPEANMWLYISITPACRSTMLPWWKHEHTTA